MSDNIPEWLRPYFKQGAYTPTKEDIENLDPQSIEEMLLKYFIDSVLDDLSNYYTKSEVDSLIDIIPKFEIKVVQTLPTTDISPTTVYLVPSQSESSDIYKEYIYVNDNWELIGIQKADLSNYYTKSEVDNLLANKVDKVTGKGLSTEDYTTNEKTKLSGIEAEANKTVITQSTGSSTTSVMSQNAVTTQLNDKATTTLYTATLLSSSWSNSAPYTQTVNISGILSTDVPIIDVVLSSTTSTAKSQMESWSFVSKIDISSGSILATCFEEKPTIDIPIQLKIVR